MALVYVGSAKATGNSAAFSVSLTALTGGADTQARAGDLVVVATGWVGTADGDPGVSTAGYTEAADLYANDTRDANLSVSWKLMGATPDTSVTVNGSGTATNGSAAVVHVWRNVDQATPLDVATTSATGINAATADSPSITPLTAGAVVLSLILATGASADTTITAPTGYGNQADTSVDPGNAVIVGIASKAWSGAGAEDPAAWTNITTSTSDSWAAATLAIRPGATSQTFSHTATGGLQSGGAGVVSKRRVNAGSGGLASGGAATTRVTHRYAVVGAGGAVSAGAATVRRTLVAVAVGGVLAGGAATTAFHPTRIYSNAFTIAASYAVTGTGGLQSGGAAVVAVRRAVTGSGGIVASGSATSSLTHPVLSNPFTITAKYVAAGSGGLQSGGASSGAVRRVWNATGGLTSGGAATTHVTHRFAAVASGGLSSGGVAGVSYVSTTHNTYSATGSGGLTASGAAAVTRTRRLAMAGGLAAAGQAGVALGHTAAGLGGLSAGGTALVALQHRYGATGSGGLASGGAAVVLYQPVTIPAPTLIGTITPVVAAAKLTSATPAVALRQVQTPASLALTTPAAGVSRVSLPVAVRPIVAPVTITQYRAAPLPSLT